jgi:streptogramin lyase
MLYSPRQQDHRFPLTTFRFSFVLILFAATQAGAQTITEYPVPTPASVPVDITAGPDGNLWFTEFTAGVRTIGRVTPGGAITEFPLAPNPANGPFGIAAGPDGNLWFTLSPQSDLPGNSAIGRITTGGVATTEVPLPDGSEPLGIAAGPDGNLWFVLAGTNAIGRITTSGVVTQFTIPTALSAPAAIAAGADGNLWFTELDANKIGRITTSGVITEFPIPTPGSQPAEITAGPDGAIWFNELAANKIGRITTAGDITEFPVPTPNAFPEGGEIVAGLDGNLWFAENSANKIGRMTTSGVVTEFAVPTANSGPSAIAAGPDGNIWFTEELGNKIGRITLGGAPPPPIDTRILPVVGSTPGANGTFFRTALQLHNSASSVISGRIVFHPSGATGSGSDPSMSYSLLPEQTQSIADLLPAMGRSGLGSADIEVTSGQVPAAAVRVFNDAGSAGTTGFTEEPMRSEEALRPGNFGVLLLPADLTNFRFNLGVRTLDGGATATLTLRDPTGGVVATVPRAFPATYHEQQGASAFLGVSTLPAGGSIEITIGSGAAIFYGATVDNRTGDPSLQIARGPFAY